MSLWPVFELWIPSCRVLEKKRVLRIHYAKLTPKTKLEGQELFFWYLAPNLPGMILEVSRLLRAHFRGYCYTELNMNWKKTEIM